MKSRPNSNIKSHIFSAFAATLLACAAVMATTSIHAQPVPGSLSPDLLEIVRFTQAHMTDDVIVAYIKSSGKTTPSMATHSFNSTVWEFPNRSWAP